jgi:uroporphyrinogen-III decarboxylase
LSSTGVDGIGPLEPAAGNDLVSLRKQLRKNITLVGNIDVDLLSRGSADQVAAETAKLVEKLGPPRRFILSSGNTISSSVKPENFKRMIETARESRVKLNVIQR